MFIEIYLFRFQHEESIHKYYIIPQKILIIIITIIKWLKVVRTVDYIKLRIYDALVRLTQSPCICHYVNTVCLCMLRQAIATRVDRRRLSILSPFYRSIRDGGHSVNFCIYVRGIFFIGCVAIFIIIV